MPSSISSSNERLPAIRFGAQWIGVAVVLAGMMAAVEFGLRRLGHEPSYSDGKVPWSMERLRVEDAPPEAIVVIGASRAHLGVSPTALEQALPGRPVIMLAMNGHRPMATFTDIADNTSFAGTVLFSFHPKFDLFVGADQSVYVRHYRDNFTHPGRYDRIFNQQIERFLQDHLVMFSPNANWATLLSSKLRPSRGRVDRRRWRQNDYRGMTPGEMKAQRTLRLAGISGKVRRNPEPDVAEFDQVLETLAAGVKKIRARGGKVVFVRLPSSGPHYELEMTKCPRPLFWDRIGPATGAGTVYWSDVPALRDFETLEYSHLDYRDAAEFTRRLARVLEEKGLLREAKP